MRERIIQRINQTKIIAIIRGIPDRSLCLSVVEAIYQGGIDLVEVTFNQSAPERFTDTTGAISAIRDRFGDKVAVGAGTVLTPEQAQMAADAGAAYLISPNADAAVIQKTRDLGLVSIPGVLSPTEIVAAADAGADFAKLFPAGLLGSDYIKAIKAPLSHIKVLAVGGVDAGNIPAFLKAGCDGFGIGGTLVNKAWIAAGAYHKITEVAESLCRAVQV